MRGCLSAPVGVRVVQDILFKAVEGYGEIHLYSMLYASFANRAVSYRLAMYAFEHAMYNFIHRQEAIRKRVYKYRTLCDQFFAVTDIIINTIN